MTSQALMRARSSGLVVTAEKMAGNYFRNFQALTAKIPCAHQGETSLYIRCSGTFIFSVDTCRKLCDVGTLWGWDGVYTHYLCFARQISFQTDEFEFDLKRLVEQNTNV